MHFLPHSVYSYMRQFGHAEPRNWCQPTSSIVPVWRWRLMEQDRKTLWDCVKNMKKLGLLQYDVQLRNKWRKSKGQPTNPCSPWKVPIRWCVCVCVCVRDFRLLQTVVMPTLCQQWIHQSRIHPHRFRVQIHPALPFYHHPQSKNLGRVCVQYWEHQMRHCQLRQRQMTGQSNRQRLTQYQAVWTSTQRNRSKFTRNQSLLSPLVVVGRPGRFCWMWNDSEQGSEKNACLSCITGHRTVTARYCWPPRQMEPLPMESSAQVRIQWLMILPIWIFHGKNMQTIMTLLHLTSMKNAVSWCNSTKESLLS